MEILYRLEMEDCLSLSCWKRRQRKVSEVGELKPCPFCGGEAGSGYEKIITIDGKPIIKAWVSCDNCHAEININESQDDYEHNGNRAAKAWNRRVQPDKESDDRKQVNQ